MSTIYLIVSVSGFGPLALLLVHVRADRVAWMLAIPDSGSLTFCA